MAWTEKYIRSDGLNGDGNSNTSTSAWTLAYALNTARTYGAPMHFYVVADGTHTITSDINAKDGFDDAQLWFEGRDSDGDAIIPTRVNGGALTVTDYPVLSLSSGARWQLGDYSTVDRLNVSGNDDVLLYYGSDCTLINSRIYNAKSSGNIYMFYPTVDYRVINCDFEDYDGGSASVLAVGATGAQVYGNHFTIHSTSGTIDILKHNQRMHIQNNLFIGNSTGTVVAIGDGATNGMYGEVIRNNTFYQCDICWESRNGTQQGPVLLAHNVAWDCDKFAHNPRSTEPVICTARNAIDSSCTDYDGATVGFHRVIGLPDISLSASPFENAATGDFRIKSSETGLVGACPLSALDLGAVQRVA